MDGRDGRRRRLISNVIRIRSLGYWNGERRKKGGSLYP